MLSEQEKQQLASQADALRQTIKSMRIELDALNNQKESLMSKRNGFRDEIFKIIGTVKSLKSERNALTSAVQLNKTEREKVDSTIQELSQKLTQLKAERQTMMGKLGITNDFGKSKREIEAIQNKIETEPMSFEKEKKLMVRLKELKREISGTEQLHTLSKQVREVARELDGYKKIRDSSHSKVQNIAKDSQKKHVNMLEESKRVDELKAQEDAAFDGFKVLKDQCKEKSDLLKAEIAKLHEIQGKLGEDSDVMHEMTMRDQKRALHQKRAEVEEKIKKKGKLTTDDLLVLQSSGSHDD